MSRLLLSLVIFGGSALSLLSFCLFPYLALPSTTHLSFTGLQLMQLGTRIPLTDQELYGYTLQSRHISEVFQNVLFMKTQFGLTVLLLPLALAGILVNLRLFSHLIRQGCMITIMSLVITTLLVILWAAFQQLFVGFGYPQIGYALVGGDLSQAGFWGLLGGEVVALIGSIIAARAADSYLPPSL